MTASNSTSPRSDSKSSLWPVSIITFFSVAIVGCVAFVAFCNMNGTDLVAQDYYEQEIRYQGQMERMARAQALPGGGASVAYDPAKRTVRLALVPAHSSSAKGLVHFYRPSAAGMDVTYPLAVAQDGSQEFGSEKLAPGLWRVKVSWRFEGQDYFVDRPVHISEAPPSQRASL